MVRSSGINRVGGLRGIRRIVSERTTPTEVTSITYTTNQFDETVEETTDHIEELWLYRGTSRLAQELIGERQVGSLNGLATTPVDIELDDRLTYNGVEYDVIGTTPLPQENPKMVAIECDERQE